MKILRPPYPRLDTFVAVDPGVKYYAWAEFVFDTLNRAGMATLGGPEANPATIVIEMPQIYRGAQSRLSDIADLTFAAGAIAGRYEQVIRYLPAEWKGQVPKDVHQARIKSALTDAEDEILDEFKKKDLIHILDAVGLGLYHTGRLGR